MITSKIWTSRFFSGIWTNRSPLRDATTSRIVEKFYGAAGDAIIAGNNVECSNKLTLVRRPGLSVYDANSYTDPDRFYEFRLFNALEEEIYIMVDEANTLSYIYDGIKTVIFNKSAGSGETYMQSVGNTLYFADGVDNKKWLQSLVVWSAGMQWGEASTPFFTTYLLDPNGNIQQLTGTSFPITKTQVTGDVLTVTSSATLTNILAVDDIVTFPSGMAAALLDGTSATVLTVTTNTFTATLVTPNYGPTTESTSVVEVGGGTPISGGTVPTWSTVVPSASNDFQGGITIDGSVQWTNRGLPIENWGIKPPVIPLTPVTGQAIESTWAANTNYSLGGVIIDSNGNLQQVITAGLSSGSTPAWPGVLYGNFTEGTVTWQMIQTAAQLNWQANFAYIPPLFLSSCNTAVAGLTTYNGVIVGGASNGLVGKMFLVTGFDNTSNNGIFKCAASTATTLKLFNALGIAETPNAGTQLSLATQRETIQYVVALASGSPCLFQLSWTGTTVMSGATAPTWQVASSVDFPFLTQTDDNTVVWLNAGFTTSYEWTPNTNYTLPNTIINVPVTINGTQVNESYFPYSPGISGLTEPNFTYTMLITPDGSGLLGWGLNGASLVSSAGGLSTFNGGWRYVIALVNTLDNTVSNATPLSVATGNFQDIAGVTIPPGDGLPALAAIDPQADYVAIFRTTDGESTPFLIPGVSTVYTLTLADYIKYGYFDTTPDTGLNNLISAAILGENTPPLPGAKNLTYHLNRIWYSVGNTVYYTTGPDTPVGNGINGTSPLNFDGMPSLVTRIVPTTQGAIIFTVSDVYIVQGNGTPSQGIQPAVPLLPGIGLLSYNALDMNGPTIGLFTTDNQFIILDPSSGTTYAGFPIGDQLRLNNNTPGQTWNPADVYVAWHVQGEDQAWYVCDGKYGWYRLMSTPAPESGYTWSPFATITGGAGAVQSIEISPGTHRLLVGPTGTGELLQRDLTVFTDNGTPYPAYAVIGSIVLAQPGQVAIVPFITTDCVQVGSPITLGILVDEALPYYTGPIDILKNWVSDPPNLPESTSFWSQRFYLSEAEETTATMRHMQVQVNFNPNDQVQNELQTITVFGAFLQEI